MTRTLGRYLNPSESLTNSLQTSNMSHLDYFGIKNFKIFSERTEFDLKPITILTGTNSSGKSSLTKAIKLVQQCFIGDIRTSLEYLRFNNDNASLGSYSNVKSKYSDDEITFYLPYWWWGVHKKMLLEICFKPMTGDSSEDGFLSSLKVVVKDDPSLIVMKLTTNLEDSESPEVKKDGINQYGPDGSLRDIGNYTYKREINVQLLKNLYEDTIQKTVEAINLFNKLERILNRDTHQVFNFKRENIEAILKKNEHSNTDELRELLLDWEYLQEFIECFHEYDSSGYGETISIDTNGFIPLVYIRIDDEQGKYFFKDRLKLSIPDKSNNITHDQIKTSPFSYLEIGKPIFEYEFLQAEYVDFPDRLINIIRNVEKRVQWEFEGSRQQSITSIDDFVSLNDLIKSRNDKDFIESNPYNINDREIRSVYESLIREVDFEVSPDDISKGISYSILNTFVINGIELARTDWPFEFNRRANYNYLKAIFMDDNLNSIPSIRSIPKRIVNRVDYTTFMEEMVNKSLERSYKINEFLRKWIVEFNIGDDVSFDSLGNTGYREINIIKNGNKYNLLDIGFGYAQLLPILLKVSLHSKQESIVIIEEPETNLHPALQSKLADFFVDAVHHFGFQFIIETHSEYLIRKLQYNIAISKIDYKDANIYYFYHPDNIPEGENQVKELLFNYNGILNGRFGSGFTDEASNLAIELFQISKGQQN